MGTCESPQELTHLSHAAVSGLGGYLRIVAFNARGDRSTAPSRGATIARSPCQRRIGSQHEAYRNASITLDVKSELDRIRQHRGMRVARGVVVRQISLS